MTKLSITELRASFNNRVITLGDAEYDKARTVFYGRIDRYPAAIIRVANAVDASKVISLARQNDLELAARSRRPRNARPRVTAGGIVLDLSRIPGLPINPKANPPCASPGLTARQRP